MWLRHGSFGGIEGELVGDKSLKQRSDRISMALNFILDFGFYFELSEGAVKVFKKKSNIGFDF